MKAVINRLPTNNRYEINSTVLTAVDKRDKKQVDEEVDVKFYLES